MSLDHCLNCSTKFDGETKYCPHCGQPAHDGKVSLYQIFKEFFTEQLNLDGRLPTSLKAFLTPGRLSIEYFAGKRKQHVNPFRLFLLLIIVALAALRFSGIDLEEVSDLDVAWYTGKKDQLTVLDSLNAILKNRLPGSQFDTIRDSIEADLRNQIRIQADSVLLNENLILLWEKRPLKVSVRDFNNLSPEDLLDKYQIEGFINRLVLHQELKLVQSPKSLVSYVVSNIPWIILGFLPFIALILKILYIRRNRFYVEHLVFSLDIHSAFLMGIIFLSIVNFWVPAFDSLILWLLLFYMIYIVLAMKRFYGQNWTKTILKFIIIVITYPIFMSFFVIVAVLLNFLLF